MTEADLLQAVEGLLASQRLGEPVFVRCLLLTANPTTDPAHRLAQLAGTIRRWFGVPLARLYAAGTVAEGQASVSLQFASGVTGLVVLARCPEGADNLDLLILGNHGAAYHEATTGEGWEETRLQHMDPDLHAAIQRSLDCGRPEVTSSGADP